MIPPFDADGNLPPGIHWVDWPEIFTRFGTTAHRLRLLAGLKSALDALRQAGCAAVYVDGSFVTTKVNPADYDACWDPRGVSPYLIDPVFLTFDAGRAMRDEACFRRADEPSRSRRHVRRRSLDVRLCFAPLGVSRA